jgi:hypothetical protein
MTSSSADSGGVFLFRGILKLAILEVEVEREPRRGQCGGRRPPLCVPRRSRFSSAAPLSSLLFSSPLWTLDLLSTAAPF